MDILHFLNSLGDHSMMTCRVYEGVCWICGRASGLTGEHKIKRTDLERYSVSEPIFRTFDGRKDKPVQGLDSKLLKFNNSICKHCNNTGTQKADRSYDAFMLEDADLFVSEGDVERNVVGPEEVRNIIFGHRIELARYFGKHLGCALKYQNFPIPRRLSRFVKGWSRKPCIAVIARSAPFWWQGEGGVIGPINALGGAYVKLRQGSESLPLSYQSAYMTGGVQFVVSMKLSALEALEIRNFALKSHKFSLQDFDEEEAKYRGVRKQ